MRDDVDFTCRVTDGHLPKLFRLRVAEYLNSASGDEVRIRISKPRRTPGLNRYYWGCIIRPIAKAAYEAGIILRPGYRNYDSFMHESFCHQILGTEVREDFLGNEVRTRKSTTDLTQAQMLDFIEQIRASELVRDLGLSLESRDDYSARTGENTSGAITDEGF
jgi:hypothetical protein